METEIVDAVYSLEDELDCCKDLIKPELSIIIPVYQAEKTLKRCVESILKQSYTNYELILVDDGSTDGSGRLCDEFAVLDSRIHVIHKKNGGVSSARNAGLEIMNGNYLMFIDGDDEIENDYFQTYFDAEAASNCDVVIGGFTRVFDSEERKCEVPQLNGIFGVEIWQEICRESAAFGYICSKLFRTDIVQSQSLRFRTDMYAQEDLEFCLSYYEFCQSFYLFQNAAYLYYYVPGKRKVPFCDFISNQLKLYRLAENKVMLLPEAKKGLDSRIQLLIYTVLYNEKERDSFDQAIKCLNQVQELEKYIYNMRVRDEKSMITKWYAKKKYKWIFYYFKKRSELKKILYK